MFLDFVAMYVSGEMKLGYFWRFEIPGAIARLLPGNHEKPSSFFIFLLKEVRTRCGVAQERFRKAPQAKDVKNFREFQIARFTPFSRRRSQNEIYAMCITGVTLCNGKCNGHISQNPNVHAG